MRDEMIRKMLAERDAKYRDFHARLCPGMENNIGVRTPILRKMAKEILKRDPEGFLREVRGEYYEETLLEGLVIAGIKEPVAAKLRRLRDFVPKIDNWATCDLVCSSLKFKPEDLPEVWEFILKYRRPVVAEGADFKRYSGEEFELRFMVVMMMDHFLTAECLTEVLDTVDRIESEDYYVEMASAWLISVAFVKFRAETLRFLEDNYLSDFVQNKAIQKIRESLRVSKDDKALMLSYKRQG